MAAAPRKIHTYDLVPDPGFSGSHLGYSHLGYYTIDFFGDSLHFVDTIPKTYVMSLVNLHKRDVLNHYITAENAKQTIKKTVENYYFHTSSMTIEEDDNLFKRQPVTKQYDHSRPINLVKQDNINEMLPDEFFSQNKRKYKTNLWK